MKNRKKKNKEKLDSKINGKEIERIFLILERSPELEKLITAKDYLTIDQGYIHTGNGKDIAEIRLKKEASPKLLQPTKYHLTFKEGEGIVRRERDVIISGAQFEEMWGMTEGKRISKTRRRIPSSDESIKIVMDILKGPLLGIIIIEAEFPSEEAANKFVPPPYFGKEITGMKEYYSGQLAINGKPKPKSETVTV